MARRKLVVHRDEHWGGLKLPEEAHTQMDKFQRDIVSFRQWLLERGFILNDVFFTIQKKM